MMRKLIRITLQAAACLAGGLVFVTGCEVAQDVFSTMGSVWDIVDAWT
jgi:hypothetical protein